MPFITLDNFDSVAYVGKLPKRFTLIFSLTGIEIAALDRDNTANWQVKTTENNILTNNLYSHSLDLLQYLDHYKRGADIIFDQITDNKKEIFYIAPPITAYLNWDTFDELDEIIEASGKSDGIELSSWSIKTEDRHDFGYYASHKSENFQVTLPK